MGRTDTTGIVQKTQIPPRGGVIQICAVKTILSVLVLAALSAVPLPVRGQGILNGGFELYDRDTHFLVGWHARGGAGRDYGAVVGGVAGSLLDYVTSTPLGLVVAMAGPTTTLEGFPVGDYWLYARGPATTIEQRFVVQADVGSLQYRALGGALGGVSVQIDGVTLEPQVKAYVQPPGPLTSGLADWWVDIRPYAGREIDLTFYIGQGTAGIDDVHLSTEIVPEPGPLILGALTAILLFVHQKLSRPQYSTFGRAIDRPAR